MEPATLDKIDLLISSLIKKETDQEKRDQMLEMMKKPILTNSDFALLFSISIRSCLRWRRKEGIPYIKIAGRVYYLWTTLIPILESRQVKN